MNLNRGIILFFMLCISYTSWAQLSKKHYIPPLFYTFFADGRNYSRFSECDISNISVQELSLATDSTTPISVTITDGGGNPLPNTPVTISSGNPMTLVLGNEDENTPMMVEPSLVNDVVSNKGLILESSSPFYASVRIAVDRDKCLRRFIFPTIFNGEFIVSKGDRALGKSFRIGNGIMSNFTRGNQYDGFLNHYIGIMATEDNTMVKLSEYDSNLEFGLYVPDNTNRLIRSISGSVQDVVLNKGESIVFIAHARLVNPKGFTGALLTSDKPIAVNTGNMYGTDTDFMVDQIVPIKYIGKRYGIIRGNDKTRDEYEYGIVVATEDNTEISLDGVSKTFINAGEHYIANYPRSNATHQNLYIESSKPVYMYQVLAGNAGGRTSNFTTGFNFIPPLSEYNYHYIDMIPRVNRLGRLTTDAYITILTKDTNKNIFINGKLASLTGLRLTASNGWITIRKLITDENVVIDSEGPIAVGIFGASGNLGYSGYFSGFSLLEAKICMSNPAVDIFNYMGTSNPAQNTPGTWLPVFSSGTNIFDPSVDVGGDYKYTYTSSSGRTRVQSVKITVTAGLDTSGMRIKNLRKECVGNDISYVIEAPNLNDGDYKVTYEIEKTGTATITKTEGVKIVNHKIDMVIKKEDISTVGSYKLKLTQIENDECIAILAIEEDFEISPDVNQNGITLTGLDCQTTTIDYTLGIEMTNATVGDEYTLNYKVTGANTKADTSIDITLDAQKQGSWTIPYAEISKIGTNMIELVSIQYKNSACPMRMPANVSKSFDTFYSNDTKVTVSRDICQGEGLGLTITDSNLLDGTYEIGYKITGSNTVTSSQEVLFTAGTRFWGIPASEIPNAGPNTLTITQIKEKNSPCILPLSIGNNFEIFPDVNQNGITLTGLDCQTTTADYTVGIGMSNATAGDEYTLNYKITGANTKANTSIDITLDAQKQASWTIPYTEISKIGTNMIELVSIQYKNSVLCPFRNPANVNKSFDTFYTNTTILTALIDICQGSDLGLIITDNNLPDDIYEIGYEITNSNTVTSSQDVTIASGTGTFMIPASEIPNAGTNTLKIISINKKNSLCVLPLSINDNFEIFPDVDQNGIILTGLDCQTTTADYTTTIIMSNATAGDEYTLTYKITGTNTKADTSIDITLDSQKQASWTIPYTEISKIGTNIIELVSIQYKNSILCPFRNPANVNKSFDTFYTNTTILTALVDICQGSDLGVTITDNNLPDNIYEIGYEITNSNTVIGSQDVTIASGTGTFMIPASEIPNAGMNTLKITSLKRKNSLCTLPLSISNNFEIFPDVNQNGIVLTGADCQVTATDYTATIEMPNATASDKYTLIYKITGSNTKADTSIEITLDAQRRASWTIPYTDISKIGLNTIELISIQHKNSICPMRTLSNVSKDFDIFYTNTTTARILRNICQGSGLGVSITDNNLSDDTYEIGYQVTNSNTVISNKEVTIISGTGILTIPASEIPNAGTNTLEILWIKKKNSRCVLPLSINNNFNIQPLISIRDINITIDACIVIDSSAKTINITNQNPVTNADIYTLIYEITGTNTLADTSVEVTMNGNNGQIIIPTNTLTASGQNTLLIKTIKHKSGNCITNVNQQYPFKTINETSLKAIQNSLPSSCTQTEQIININLDNAIAGHSYKLSYRLSVANTSSNIEIDIVPNALGEASFTIPASYFRNKGTTLITIGTVTGCEDKVTNPMNIDTNIILDLIPIISNTDVSIPNYVCFGTDVLVSIGNRKTIDNGVSYTVMYRLSGSNTTSELTHTQVANNQEITFTIPSNSLPLGGITNLEIIKIVADTGCSYVPAISKSFTVVKIDLSKNNYNEQNECKGSSIIKINNPDTSITDGQYQLNYMINQQSKTVEIDVIRSIILMTIPREDFKEGQNELELNRLTHISSGCSASFTNKRYNIDKQGLLDFDKISISVPSLFCNGGDDLEVMLNIPSLSNVTEFEIKYDLSGENVHKEIVQQTIINTKKVVFKIPERYLKNRGNTTITIRNIKAKNINCEGDNMNLSKDFFTSITPSISSQEINPDYYFCREDNPILSDIYIKSSLADNVLWYDALESTQALEKSFKLIKNQTLYIKKKNDDGCLSDLISSNINFDVCDNIKIPTKVSVNGDNINESFKVKDLGKLYPNYKINIYNRNGIFVYEDYDTVDSFVGYPNQSEQILNATTRLPRGIYYYVLFYNDTINNKKPSQGYFYLNY